VKRESTILLTCVVTLVLMGAFTVYSAGAVWGNGYNRLVPLAYFGIGLLILFLASHFDYRRLSDPLVFRTVALISLVLLILVLIPGIGTKINGAWRWISVGNFTFQPSEFAKFSLVLLLAVKLSQNHEQVKDFSKGFLPPMFIAGFFVLLVLMENDLGTPVVLSAVAFIMLFIAGVRWRYLLPSVLPGVIMVYILILVKPHRVTRLKVFLDPWNPAYEGDESMQLIAGFAGFARGGFFGQGPGASEQKLHYLPAQDTDFIFAVWGEEMGLMGSLSMVFLYAVILVVGLRIALGARDLFGTLLAGGIVSLLAFQAAFNMAVTTGLLPTKGLALPFISSGGSALLVFLGMMGILLNIGLQAEEASARTGRVASD